MQMSATAKETVSELRNEEIKNSMSFCNSSHLSQAMKVVLQRRDHQVLVSPVIHSGRMCKQDMPFQSVSALYFTCVHRLLSLGKAGVGKWWVSDCSQGLVLAGYLPSQHLEFQCRITGLSSHTHWELPQTDALSFLCFMSSSLLHCYD